MAAISIRRLTKRFELATVLTDINLDINAGELFFLLGPSGCGKTTLLRHIAGFYQPDVGSIFFGDEDVTALPPHKRGTGMMFQSYALWPHLTVAENVAFGLEEQKRPRAEITARVEEILALVQLAGLGARRIQQLSGGQQQRVALARALVVRPRCLLLDEPLSNLDAVLRLSMRTEIRAICKRFGLTGVYVTHDQEEALSMADRIAVMDKGRLQQQASPLDIYRRPANRMVAEFIGETNFISGTVLAGSANDANVVSVQTALGVLTARVNAVDWQPLAGQMVTISVRPECLLPADHQHNAQAPRLNRFRGQIAEASYLGSSAQYQLRAQPDVLLKISQMNPSVLLQPSEQTIEVVAAIDDLVVLPL
jgi:iron(III) transport system ATP-binding protein